MAMPPKSSIVLAIATCIPFGLAIRDTIAGKYEVPDFDALERSGGDDGEYDDEDYRDVARRRELEELENRRAVIEYEAHQEAMRAERRANLERLYSAEVALPGTAFEAVKLGQPEVELADIEGVTTWFANNGEVTFALYVKPVDRDEGDCEALENGLRGTWGEPKARHDYRVWLNEPQRMRAVWLHESCTLVFEKLVTLDVWFNKSPSSVIPLWAIGKPAQQLRDALGARVTDLGIEDRITWTVPSMGVGYGMGVAHADLVNGKVVSLHVGIDIDTLTQSALAERITTLTGKDPIIPSDRPDVEIWKSGPGYMLEEGAPQSFLTIGKRPE